MTARRSVVTTLVFVFLEELGDLVVSFELCLAERKLRNVFVFAFNS